jgi:hypothetical protein
MAIFTFICPHCGESNVSDTPLDAIFMARRQCSKCKQGDSHRERQAQETGIELATHW